MRWDGCGKFSAECKKGMEERKYFLFLLLLLLLLLFLSHKIEKSKNQRNGNNWIQPQSPRACIAKIKWFQIDYINQIFRSVSRMMVNRVAFVGKSGHFLLNFFLQDNGECVLAHLGNIFIFTHIRQNWTAIAVKQDDKHVLYTLGMRHYCTEKKNRSMILSSIDNIHTFGLYIYSYFRLFFAYSIILNFSKTFLALSITLCNNDCIKQVIKIMTCLAFIAQSWKEHTQPEN